MVILVGAWAGIHHQCCKPYFIHFTLTEAAAEECEERPLWKRRSKRIYKDLKQHNHSLAWPETGLSQVVGDDFPSAFCSWASTHCFSIELLQWMHAVFWQICRKMSISWLSDSSNACSYSNFSIFCRVLTKSCHDLFVFFWYVFIYSW